MQCKKKLRKSQCVFLKTTTRMKTYTFLTHSTWFSFVTVSNLFYSSGPLLQKTRARQYFLKAAEVFSSMNPHRIPH